VIQREVDMDRLRAGVRYREIKKEN